MQAAAYVRVIEPQCHGPRCTATRSTDEQGWLHTCSRCHLVQYCSAKCQRRDWDTHKAQCRIMASVIDPSIARALRNRKTAPCDVVDYGIPQGYGLRARRKIMPGEIIGVAAGVTRAAQSDIEFIHSPPKCTTTCGVLGFVGWNACMANDTAPVSALDALREGQTMDAVRSLGSLEVLTEANCMYVPLRDAVVQGEDVRSISLRTTKPVEAGEQLRVVYGLDYWLGLTASGLLHGVTFTGALRACLFFLRGDPQYDELERRGELTSTVAPGLPTPVWIHKLGDTMYAGRFGIDAHFKRAYERTYQKDSHIVIRDSNAARLNAAGSTDAVLQMCVTTLLNLANHLWAKMMPVAMSTYRIHRVRALLLSEILLIPLDCDSDDYISQMENIVSTVLCHPPMQVDHL